MVDHTQFTQQVIPNPWLFFFRRDIIFLLSTTGEFILLVVCLFKLLYNLIIIYFLGFDLIFVWNIHPF